MKKKKLLVWALIILALVYFRKTIYLGFFGLVWFLLPDTPMPSDMNICPNMSQSDYDRLPPATHMYDSTRIEADTILDIDMDCGGSDDPKMWIGIEGDTIWK